MGVHATFVVETDAWERAIADAVDETLASAEAELGALADLAVERMQAYCPTGEDGSHELLESIAAVPGRDEGGFFIHVGTFGVFYSLFVEMGTSVQPGQPFIRPGLEEAVANWSGNG